MQDLMRNAAVMSMTLKEITDLLAVRHNDAMNVVEKMAESPEFGELRKIHSSYINNIAEDTLNTYHKNLLEFVIGE